ncbi:signal peptidase I [Candidatus Roizmanbacteria bacterium CG10_big_fil_rev_8_21_14_0_10_39_6]|uniref:Signal peptidase I n=1 Tax=Candidatus Roizmanbacteria bacterium CG10_big_fil_rev_8_21_14_0_10_39_6 TaxID=1974853 RepID=A0A2M8KSX6_9BACT|nr:MAG: signal peptidase I [Candidatus Roizmanbacteria bacterium CG10_big_fil_rev_8_21_14_0_10_39_6]
MKFLSRAFSIVSWIFIALFALLLGLTYLSNQNVGIFNMHSFLVLSGSMEPTIMTGDIIIISSQPAYAQRDVVTFKNIDERIVTHRLMKKVGEGKTVRFETKGDANRSEDEDLIQPDQILGKVVLVIPKLGYLVAFSKTVPGFIVFIVIPAFLLLVGEILDRLHG